MRMEHRSSKSGLFLMELIIAIGFFAVSSAICIQLFAKSHALSKTSGDLSAASAVAQSHAESFKAQATSDFADGRVEEYFYDQGWRLSQTRDWAYKAVLSYRLQDDLLYLDVSVYTGPRTGDEPLYSITACKYIPQ